MPNFFRIVAFGLWTGVMIGFAFIFAPAAFRILGPVPQFAAMIAQIIGSITIFGYACTAVVVVAAILERARTLRSKILTAIAVIMAALSWWEMQYMVPMMQRTQLATPAYESLHHKSSTIYSVVLILGLAALLWSARQERATAA